MLAVIAQVQPERIQSALPPAQPGSISSHGRFQNVLDSLSSERQADEESTANQEGGDEPQSPAETVSPPKSATETKTWQQPSEPVNRTDGSTQRSPLARKQYQNLAEWQPQGRAIASGDSEPTGRQQAPEDTDSIFSSDRKPRKTASHGRKIQEPDTEGVGQSTMIDPLVVAASSLAGLGLPLQPTCASEQNVADLESADKHSGIPDLSSIGFSGPEPAAVIRPSTSGGVSAQMIVADPIPQPDTDRGVVAPRLSGIIKAGGQVERGSARQETASPEKTRSNQKSDSPDTSVLVEAPQVSKAPDEAQAALQRDISLPDREDRRNSSTTQRLNVALPARPADPFTSEAQGPTEKIGLNPEAQRSSGGNKGKVVDSSTSENRANSHRSGDLLSQDGKGNDQLGGMNVMLAQARIDAKGNRGADPKTISSETMVPSRANSSSFVQSGHLVRTLNGSELRLNLYSSELGRIDIHGTLKSHEFVANIYVENQTTERALTASLPALESKLHHEQEVIPQIHVQVDTNLDQRGARQQQDHQGRRERILSTPPVDESNGIGERAVVDTDDTKISVHA